MLKILKLLFFFTNVFSSNMNGNIYSISNSKSNSFSTEFEQISPNIQYFDVYSPIINSRYGEVFWTMMDPIKLPDEVVSRFNNSVMAILGYETDQVFKNQGEHGTDLSVPITWSYNHHYEAYIHSKNTNIKKVYNHTNDKGVYNHGYNEMWKVKSKYDTNQNGIPLSQFFSEGNGGESRGSFHGYPSNMAQLIESPHVFRIQPMQIDTRNRSPKYINSSIFHPGILPKESASPKNASYSGLLECPCTNRIVKQINHNYINSLNVRCLRNIVNKTQCKNQGIVFGKRIFNIVNSTELPYGCSINASSINFNLFNSFKNCSNKNTSYIGSIHFKELNISMSVKIDSVVNIQIIGPSDRWFGVGFNAKSMNDQPYALIINDNINEFKLANHASGTQLNNSIKIISNKVVDSSRIVEISRSIVGITKDHYTFSSNKGTIPIISAIGKDNKYAYHFKRSGSKLSYINDEYNTCLCDDGITGKINGIPFSKHCANEPIADLLVQKNPTCFINTYAGGLSCCHHKNILLDKEQEQPKHIMSYQLKFRFWYEPYINHESLIRLYFQTEAYAGEYDIPKCINPYECIHTITARWKSRDMIDPKYINSNNSGVKLVYAGPHCHAPSCISMELYNEDTGNLICKVDGVIGKGSKNKFDEIGYIKLNPCLWGYDNGLYNPPILNWNTNLLSIKKNNNTNKHYGEMASWQMRGVIV